MVDERRPESGSSAAAQRRPGAGAPLKVAVAGKGGAGKTTIAAALAERLADRGLRTLAVDCDPNPNLAESFGLESARLARFTRDDLRRVGETLALAREPELVEAAPALWVLGGPPSDAPLADAVARGIAGVLVAERFDAVVTDLGAGWELAQAAVGGPLNPADVCVVVSTGRPVGELTAERVEAACRAREVPALRVTNAPGRARELASELAERLASGRR